MAKPADAIPTYKAMRSNIRNMKLNIAKLMRHPDTTPEQLWETHLKYVQVWASFIDVTNKLREKFPLTRYSIITMPWHDNLEGE